MRRERIWGLPRQLLLLSAASAVVVFAVYALLVRTYWGQKLDEYAFRGREVISEFREGQANEFLSVVSIGSLVLVTVLIAAFAFARRRPRLALLAAGSLFAAVVSTEILKLVLLERPILYPSILDILNERNNTYPSGHATIGMGIALAVLLVVPARLRWVTAFGAGVIGSAFGVAVVAAGWHRPSDVVGAYFVCLATAALAAAIARAYPDRPPDPEPPPSRPRFGRGELALVGLALAVVALFGLAALTIQGIPWTSAGAGFLISSAALVALAFAITGALALAMSAADAASAEERPAA